jgi:hypothetical protein
MSDEIGVFSQPIYLLHDVVADSLRELAESLLGFV